MAMDPREAVVLIPSLEPDDRLVPYLRQLLHEGISHIVVVDDGSGPSYQAIFSQIEGLEQCHVLHHEKNRGKGEALKTGYAYIRKAFPKCLGVVTADSDGQHTAGDVWALAQRLAQGEEGLLLGTRDFSLSHVPGKSRAGNRITSFIFWVLYGRWLQDTQTGLRAFSARHLPFMINVEGSRFEYEMNVLIACARDNLPMKAVPIETVYENQNKGTHFHPLKDSMRIYKVIFHNFFRFMSSSFLATGLDLGINFVLYELLLAVAMPDVSRYAIAMGTARLISSGVNFFVNKNFVFHFRSQNSKTRETLFRYLALCIASWTASWGLVSAMCQYLGFSYRAAVVVVNILLFFANYRIQQRWVFKNYPQYTRQGESVK